MFEVCPHLEDLSLIREFGAMNFLCIWYFYYMSTDSIPEKW